jgi:hypothetical protein
MTSLILKNGMMMLLIQQTIVWDYDWSWNCQKFSPGMESFLGECNPKIFPKYVWKKKSFNLKNFF